MPGGQSLTQGMFTNKLKELLSTLGLPGQFYASHSFRRGGATYLFRQGIPGELIQVMGDWKSEAYKVYLEIDLPTKFQILKTKAN